MLSGLLDKREGGNGESERSAERGRKEERRRERREERRETREERRARTRKEERGGDSEGARKAREGGKGEEKEGGSVRPSLHTLRRAPALYRNSSPKSGRSICTRCVVAVLLVSCWHVQRHYLCRDRPPHPSSSLNRAAFVDPNLCIVHGGSRS